LLLELGTPASVALERCLESRTLAAIAEERDSSEPLESFNAGNFRGTAGGTSGIEDANSSTARSPVSALEVVLGLDFDLFPRVRVRCKSDGRLSTLFEEGTGSEVEGGDFVVLLLNKPPMLISRRIRNDPPAVVVTAEGLEGLMNSTG